MLSASCWPDVKKRDRLSWLRYVAHADDAGDAILAGRVSAIAAVPPQVQHHYASSAKLRSPLAARIAVPSAMATGRVHVPRRRRRRPVRNAWPGAEGDGCVTDT
jgi:hypothetical protein